MELSDEDSLEPQIDERILQELDEIYKSHMKRKDRKNMTMKELNILLKLCL
ncbi:MAG: hypothetical protein PHU51_01945 [Candidatus Nanoarchaeia archaeon]|nr:hypothetical protein [Candidatus Nanoarchaeia archaeon]